MRDFESGNDAWQLTRKKQWATIKQGLQRHRKCMGSAYLPNGKQLGALQRYWLTGQSSERLPLAFRVWAHPEPSPDIVERFLRQTSKEEWGWSRGFWYEIAMVDPRLPALDLFGPNKKVLRDVFGPLQDSTIQVADGPIAVRSPVQFLRWWRGVTNWMELRVSNANYCMPDYSERIWSLAPAHCDDLGEMHGALHQAAHFIEPQELQGAGTPHRLFAERFARELDSQALPEYVRVLWERLKTRAGRASYWDSDIRMLDYGDLGGYEVVVAHDADVGEGVIDLAGKTFESLGLGVPDSNGIESVEISRALSRPFAHRLGYENDARIPAHRLRIRTSPDFVDSDRAEIHVDVLVPVPNPLRPLGDRAPSLLFVPRPKEGYVLYPALGYQLNYRLFQRTFAERTGIVLEPYVTMGEWEGDERTAERFWGPCYKADYQPLKLGRNALLDDAEHDFPAWEGELLAPLGS